MPPEPLRYDHGHRYNSGLRYGQLLPDPPTPRRTRQLASTYTPPPHPMNFTFIVKPTPDGENFSTRCDFGPDWTQAELDTAVSAAHGVPAEKCRAIGRQYFLELLNAPTPRRTLRLFDLLYTRPSSGGSQPGPDDFHTPTDLKADMTIGYLAEVIRDWREGLTIERTGQEGVAVPKIDTILNEANGTPNTYTALQNIRLVGANLDFDKINAVLGVFIAPAAGGPWVRLTTYGPITQGQIYVLIPTGTTGAQRIKVVNRVGHETVYTTPIAP